MPFWPLWPSCPLAPLWPFTSLIPFLFFISPHPTRNEPPCSRGELIGLRRVPDKHGIMAARYAEKSGVWGLPGRAHFGDFDGQPKVDFGQRRIEPVVAGGIAKVGRGRLQPQQGRGAERAAEHLNLELIQGVEGVPAPPDGAAAPLRRVILTLQGDQCVDAADGAERGGRLR